MQTAFTFKRIALMGRRKHSGIEETLVALCQHLQAKHCQVYVEEETAGLFEFTAPTLALDAIAQCADLIIAVGGDGSLLHAARIAADNNLPVLGINRGRLGFLTDIYPDEISKIDSILNGIYQEEQRFLLTTHLMSHSHAEHEAFIGDALNDVVFLPSELAHMIDFDIYINQQFVCNQRADGLIIATPTGSTAYALSGGGPILHPQLDAIVLVTMFPHTLSSRPIVVTGDSEIVISITSVNANVARVNCDGQERINLLPNSALRIRKKAQPLRLIHPMDYHYFETLRAKLNWQSKLHKDFY